MVRTKYSLDTLHLTNILQSRTNEVSFNPPVDTSPFRCLPGIGGGGGGCGWAESVGTTYIGKLDLWETFVNLWVPGVSKEITSRISPRLTSVATFILLPPFDGC